MSLRKAGVHLGNLIVIGHIHQERAEAVAIAFGSGQELIKFFTPMPRHNHCCAASEQRKGCRPPYSCGTTGNHRNLVLEFHIPRHFNSPMHAVGRR